MEGCGILEESMRNGEMEDGGRFEKRRWLFGTGRMVWMNGWV